MFSSPNASTHTDTPYETATTSTTATAAAPSTFPTLKDEVENPNWDDWLDELGITEHRKESQQECHLSPLENLTLPAELEERTLVIKTESPEPQEHEEEKQPAESKKKEPTKRKRKTKSKSEPGVKKTNKRGKKQEKREKEEMEKNIQSMDFNMDTDINRLIEHLDKNLAGDVHSAQKHLEILMRNTVKMNTALEQHMRKMYEMIQNLPLRTDSGGEPKMSCKYCPLHCHLHLTSLKKQTGRPLNTKKSLPEFPSDSDTSSDEEPNEPPCTLK